MLRFYSGLCDSNFSFDITVFATKTTSWWIQLICKKYESHRKSSPILRVKIPKIFVVSPAKIVVFDDIPLNTDHKAGLIGLITK